MSLLWIFVLGLFHHSATPVSRFLPHIELRRQLSTGMMDGNWGLVDDRTRVSVLRARSWKDLSSIETLPYELYPNIFRFLGKKDIKSLRQSSTRLSAFGPEQLFQGFDLFMNEQSFSRLESLASHEQYSKLVRTMHCWFPAFRKELTDKSKFSKTLDVELHRRLKLLHKYHPGDNNGIRQYTWQEGEHAFLQYKRCFEDQEQLRGTPEAIDRLTTAMKKFTCLRKIIFEHYFFDSHFNIFELETCTCFRYTSLRRSVERELILEVITFPYTASFLHTFCNPFSEAPDRATLDSSARYVKWILSAVHRSRISLKSLAVGQIGPVQGLPVSEMYLPIDLKGMPILREVLSKVEDVSLFLDDHIDHRFREWKGNQFLRLLPSLKTLLLKHSSSRKMIKDASLDIFAGCHWPQLQTVSINSMEVSGEHLKDFIRAHHATLRSVRFERVTLKGKGTWRRCLKALRDCRGLGLQTQGGPRDLHLEFLDERVDGEFWDEPVPSYGIDIHLSDENAREFVMGETDQILIYKSSIPPAPSTYDY
ncbi:MAG: hypothetical protein M1837_000193 [Sclerophora amabilis]|nr:MAG: hypothetical protein M1837_000193 [Sclerophora amabilis]